jgi:NADPH2:quinone reductase
MTGRQSDGGQSEGCTVKAAIYDHTGPAAEVLRVVDIERPEPGPGEVRVRVHVSGVNPTDVKARSGQVPQPIDGFQIPHQDGAGVIDAVGPGGPEDRIGQRVWVYLAAAGRRWGTAAEWTVVPEHRAVPLPDGASAELGASLGVPAVTAHHLVFADGPVKDATVLVAGGSGAVGHFSIEFARWGGAGRVASTVSSPDKAELARQAGAAHVVFYTDPDAASQITAAVGKVDRIIEVALGANLQLDLAISRPGTVVTCYAAEPKDPVLPVRACMAANIVLRFMLLYTLPQEVRDQAVADIGTALRAGALTGLPEHRFPLEEIVAAHEAVEQHTTGKVLVIPG